jgi:homoserine dehydrogenase
LSNIESINSDLPITVLKLGGSVLANHASLAQAVHEIYREVRRGHRVVAVVSALAGVTDRLLASAASAKSEPEPAALARLLATGEAQSVSLLGLELDRAGIPCHLLDAARAGLHTAGPLLDATLDGVDAEGLRKLLQQRSVAVIPGFVGLDRNGETSLLGRGGSDLTALYLAHALNAECRLLKDVEGLFEYDPAAPGPAPQRFKSVTFEDALKLDESIVQHKALRFARDHRLTFRVTRCQSAQSTLVGASTSAFAPPIVKARALKVGLLGCGTVGTGVLKEILALPERFEITQVAVRNTAGHNEAWQSNVCFTANAQEVINGDCDAIIELIGGTQDALPLVRQALRQGKSVITANKDLVAQYGAELSEVARGNHVQLLYSASVGGALPALEATRSTAKRSPIRKIEGVLNGTTNFILDRVCSMVDFGTALEEAQARGFAEADPSSDLSGRDAVHKLVLLVKAAFGVQLNPQDIPCTGIADDIGVKELGENKSNGQIRLIASCELDALGELVASVEPRWVESDHPFANTHAEGNALLITPFEGPQQLWTGKGAGSWPTTEAVIADLFDLSRAISTCDKLQQTAVA